MGIVDKGIEKSWARQKDSLLKEAQKAGCDVLQVEHFSSDEGTTKAAIGAAIKAMVGGKVGINAFHLLKLQTGDLAHVFVQPYAGMNPMPGEHHVLLPGTLPAPIALTEGILGHKWETSDAALAKRLNKESPDLKKVAKKCEFDWAIGMSKVELEWAVQVYSHGDGRSTVVMQTGRYGGITTYEVGFSQFLALIKRFAEILVAEHTPAQHPIHPVSYQALAEDLLDGNGTAASQSVEPSSRAESLAAIPPAAHGDYSQLICSSMEGYQRKKIHVGDIPPKKDRNVRDHVLPPAARNDRLVAVLDLTTFGSAKDAIALTPTHCYAREMDDRVSFAFSDVEGVDGFGGLLKGKVLVNIRNIGQVAVPCSGEEAGNPLIELLSKVARIGSITPPKSQTVE